jgi:hypothetical protein
MSVILACTHFTTRIRVVVCTNFSNFLFGQNLSGLPMSAKSQSKQVLIHLARYKIQTPTTATPSVCVGLGLGPIENSQKFYLQKKNLKDPFISVYIGK